MQHKTGPVDSAKMLPNVISFVSGRVLTEASELPHEPVVQDKDTELLPCVDRCVQGIIINGPCSACARMPAFQSAPCQLPRSMFCLVAAHAQLWQCFPLP